MIEKLRDNPAKIPTVGRNDIMNLIIQSWNELHVDVESRYKALWLTNALDGTEDSFVSDKIFQLVGHDLMGYREKLMNSKCPPNLKSLIKKITPPKGVKRNVPEHDEKPEDEGTEMFDCEGVEIVMVDPEEDVEEEPSVPAVEPNASTINEARDNEWMFTAPILEYLCPDNP